MQQGWSVESCYLQPRLTHTQTCRHISSETITRSSDAPLERRIKHSYRCREQLCAFDGTARAQPETKRKLYQQKTGSRMAKRYALRCGGVGVEAMIYTATSLSRVFSLFARRALDHFPARRSRKRDVARPNPQPTPSLLAKAGTWSCGANFSLAPGSTRRAMR